MDDDPIIDNAKWAPARYAGLQDALGERVRVLGMTPVFIKNVDELVRGNLVLLGALRNETNVVIVSGYKACKRLCNLYSGPVAYDPHAIKAFVLWGEEQYLPITMDQHGNVMQDLGRWYESISTNDESTCAGCQTVVGPDGGRCCSRCFRHTCWACVIGQDGPAKSTRCSGCGRFLNFKAL